MAVVINYKVCNLGAGCPCITACPSGAWFWDSKNHRPAVNNSKCNSCGICTKQCPARVISGALDETGIKKIQKELESDPRSQELLNAERFNVEPKDQSICIDAASFKKEVLESSGTVIVDIWAPQFGARCRNSTFTYEEILPKGTKATFKKLNALENVELCKSMGLTVLPSLAIYHKGKLIDYIAGKIGLAEKEQIKERIVKALAKC